MGEVDLFSLVENKSTLPNISRFQEVVLGLNLQVDERRPKYWSLAMK